MKANTLYNELSKVAHWAAQSRKVRWLAARYYAGVESLAELRSHSTPQPFGDYTLPALLTPAQVEMIIQLR